MQRVLVAGTPGSGKTTVARLLAAQLGLPHFELDALHHGPGWTKRPTFEADVVEFCATDRWVTEDQYHRFLDELLWSRADTRRDIADRIERHPDVGVVRLRLLAK